MWCPNYFHVWIQSSIFENHVQALHCGCKCNQSIRVLLIWTYSFGILTFNIPNKWMNLRLTFIKYNNSFIVKNVNIIGIICGVFIHANDMTFVGHINHFKILKNHNLRVITTLLKMVQLEPSWVHAFSSYHVPPWYSNMNNFQISSLLSYDTMWHNSPIKIQTIVSVIFQHESNENY